MKGEKYKILIDEESAGERVDSFLSRFFDDFSRSYIVKLIESGGLKVGGDVCRKKNEKLMPGSNIEIFIPEAAPKELLPEQIDLEIVYEDKDLAVVNKPKGMVVHPAHGNESGTLVNAMLYHTGELSRLAGDDRPGIVHRIDKDTSGLLVIAKSDEAYIGLTQQLAAHSVKREYRAVVNGTLKQENGKIDAPIGRDKNNRMRMAVTHENSKHAVTHYTLLERFGNYSYIKAVLETGRTHQIRVHMSYINNPLVGDKVYSGGKNKFGIDGHVLHAKTLGFIHPITGEYLEFDSELPDEFENLLIKLKRRA